MATIELPTNLVSSLARRWECEHLPALQELLDEVSTGAPLSPADRALLATVRADLAAAAGIAGAEPDALVRLGALEQATGTLIDAILTRSEAPAHQGR